MEHRCSKFTYENVVIEYDEKNKMWQIVIDSEVGAFIFYCPFCGKRLEVVDES